MIHLQTTGLCTHFLAITDINEILNSFLIVFNDHSLLPVMYERLRYQDLDFISISKI